MHSNDVLKGNNPGLRRCLFPSNFGGIQYLCKYNRQVTEQTILRRKKESNICTRLANPNKNFIFIRNPSFDSIRFDAVFFFSFSGSFFFTNAINSMAIGLNNFVVIYLQTAIQNDRMKSNFHLEVANR